MYVKCFCDFSINSLLGIHKLMTTDHGEREVTVTKDRRPKTDSRRPKMKGSRGPKTSYLTPNANPKSNPNADAGTGTGGVQGRVIGD